MCEQTHQTKFKPSYVLLASLSMDVCSPMEVHTTACDSQQSGTMVLLSLGGISHPSWAKI
jgi:hypothetical protein